MGHDWVFLVDDWNVWCRLLPAKLYRLLLLRLILLFNYDVAEFKCFFVVFNVI